MAPRSKALKQSTARDSWATPPEIAKWWVYEYDLVLDVAASQHNAKCSRYYTADDDAIKQPWDANWWCNPPYTKIPEFIAKAESSDYPGVMLLPARTDSEWFQRMILSDKWNIYFSRKRINFIPADGIMASSNSHGSIMAVYHRGFWTQQFGSFNAKTGEIVYSAGG